MIWICHHKSNQIKLMKVVAKLRELTMKIAIRLLSVLGLKSLDILDKTP